MTVKPEIEEEALRWFVQLSDADAPAAAWLEFQDWLERDEAHRLAYAAIERTWIDLDGEETAPVPLRVAANDSAPLSRRAWLFPSVAAAAALVLSIGLWTQISGQGAVQTYRTEDASRALTLSDGTQVYLNRHSDVTVRMKGDSRSVTLDDGEAAFDVAHDATRPFVVTASGRQIRVLGTAFNVLNHDDRFSVSVERGIVAVTPASSRTPVRLTVGQKIDQTGDAASVLSRIDPARASTWRQGVLIYRNAPLAEVADDLSRYLDKPVTLSPSAQPLHFTGALRVGDEATMLKQLQDFVPVQTTRSSIGIDLTARGDR